MAQTDARMGRIHRSKMRRPPRRWHPVRVDDPDQIRERGRWCGRGPEGCDLSSERRLHKPGAMSPWPWPRVPASAVSRLSGNGRSTALNGPGRTGGSPAPRWWRRGGNLVASEGGGGEQVVVTAEHVVTATGNHAAAHSRRLLGDQEAPALPRWSIAFNRDLEPDPALVEWRGSPTPSPPGGCAMTDAKWYLPREERGGWILGPYEHGAPRAVLYEGARDVPRRPLPARILERSRRNKHVDDPPDSVLGDGGSEGRLQTVRSVTRRMATPLVGANPRRACAHHVALAEGFSLQGSTAAGRVPDTTSLS